MTDLSKVNTEAIKDRLRANWQRTQIDVANAAEMAGRDPNTVQIVGVTKYVDAEMTKLLFDVGCAELGENRPQMLWQKAEILGASPDGIQSPRWHMIGHVQTNKLRRMMRYSPLIHSVDSERLLRAINEESKRSEIVSDVLVEVNISGDKNKTGLAAEPLHQLLNLKELSHVRVCGLMAMAGFNTDANQALAQFQSVETLRTELEQSTGKPLPELSMGMSGDYPQAISAGATIVRIGSALFDGITLSK